MKLKIESHLNEFRFHGINFTRKSLTISALFDDFSAQFKALSPASFLTKTSASSSINSLTVATWPPRTAIISEVDPLGEVESIYA